MSNRPHERSLRGFTEVAQALSDPSRVRALLALRGRELCVCQLVELLELAASTVSKHMTLLRRAGLVEQRKDGRWAYYRRVGRDGPKHALAAIRWLDASLPGSAPGDDDRRLKRILSVPLEELCRTGSRD